MRSKEILSTRARTLLMGTTVLAGATTLLLATTPVFAQDNGAMETVTVTGYRASLEDSTNAKRASINFTDSVFAEDIGKYPDTNVAEAFNRIPGITITRENDGSGMRVAIRGLDTNHVKVTLNGNTVQTASTGNTDANGANREVDLNIFPIELFTQLTVSKTAEASQLEGGAAGIINMRSMRPFDNPGMHFSYNLQASDYENNGNIGGRGTLIASDTEGPFGLLVGLSGQWNRVMTTGYEGAFNGLTVPSLTPAQFYGTQANPSPTQTCTATSVTSPGTTSTANITTCNPIGGQNGWTLPTVFPNTGVPASYVGKTITSDLLLALNPGLTMTQIGSAIIPRTGRPMFESGTRNRYNGIMSFEYRPTDDLHFYLDTILGVIENNLDREDLFWVGRFGSSIPMNMTVDANNVVTSGDFANATMALEARPYKEKSDYISLNPGVDWQVTDLLHVDANINYSRAHFFRDSPTFMPATPLGIVHYDNTGAVPTFSMSGLPHDGGVQNPDNFGWNGGSALRLQQERRYEYTKGAHANVRYGGDEFNVQIGAAWDEQYRLIRGYDNGALFGEANCSFNPTTYLPGPNSTSGCSLPPYNIPGAWAANWGHGYTAGMGALPTAQGPVLPSADVPNYLLPGPNGFVRVNYKAIEAVTNYNFYATNPPPGAATNLQDPGRTGFSIGTNTNISSGIIDEETEGFYGEVNGVVHRGDQRLRYNIGLRWIRTLQSLTGYTSVADPRNAAQSLGDGARYPNYITPATLKGSYSAVLPSANLVWELTDDFQLRGAVSRTMTRANPASMLPQLSGGGSGADTWNLGNPNLRPFYSTNIDLGAELYTGGEGLISVGIFKKMITGFPSNYTSTQYFPWLAQFGYTLQNFALGSSQYGNIMNKAIAGGCWDAAAGANNTANCVNIYVTQARNATGLETIKGMEFGWVQPLDFLLKDYGLEGFGWQANATVISTKTTQGSAAPSVVLNVSPLTYNLTGYYDANGVMVKVSYAYQRGTITNSNVYGIIWGFPYFTQERSLDYATVDLSSSLKLSRILGELPTDPEVTFDIQNLTHAKVGRSYKMYPNLLNYSYNPGSLFMIGVRGSF